MNESPLCEPAQFPCLSQRKCTYCGFPPPPQSPGLARPPAARRDINPARGAPPQIRCSRNEGLARPRSCLPSTRSACEGRVQSARAARPRAPASRPPPAGATTFPPPPSRPPTPRAIHPGHPQPALPPPTNAPFPVSGCRALISVPQTAFFFPPHPPSPPPLYFIIFF